jgi:uncharacterized membrane protein
MVKNILKVISLLVLIFICLFSIFEIFNVGSLYKDQIETAGTYPNGYTLDEWALELKITFYFFWCTAIVSPILFLYIIYSWLKAGTKIF